MSYLSARHVNVSVCFESVATTKKKNELHTLAFPQHLKHTFMRLQVVSSHFCCFRANQLGWHLLGLFCEHGRKSRSVLEDGSSGGPHTALVRGGLWWGAPWREPALTWSCVYLKSVDQAGGQRVCLHLPSPLGAALAVNWSLWLPAAGNAERGGSGGELPFPRYGAGWWGAWRAGELPGLTWQHTLQRLPKGRASRWDEYCKGKPAGLTSCRRLPAQYGNVTGSCEELFEYIRDQRNQGKTARETTSTSCSCVEKMRGAAWGRKTGRVFLRRSSFLAWYLLVLQENGNTE